MGQGSEPRGGPGGDRKPISMSGGGAAEVTSRLGRGAAYVARSCVLTCLFLCVFICIAGLIPAPPSWGCSEDYVKERAEQLHGKCYVNITRGRCYY